MKKNFTKQLANRIAPMARKAGTLSTNLCIYYFAQPKMPEALKKMRAK